MADGLTRQSEKAIKAYPLLKATYQALKYSGSSTSYGSSSGHGSGHSDPTADVALRSLPKLEQWYFEGVEWAIRHTARKECGKERLLVIRLHYWQDNLSLPEISEKLNISLKTVEWHIDQFSKEVRHGLNIPYCNGCVYYRRFSSSLKACHYFLDTGQLRLTDGVDLLLKGPRDCPHFTKKEVSNEKGTPSVQP